eukprot:7391643-Heterocapsa_arctica.AAC.1
MMSTDDFRNSWSSRGISRRRAADMAHHGTFCRRARCALAGGSKRTRRNRGLMAGRRTGLAEAQIATDSRKS